MIRAGIALAAGQILAGWAIAQDLPADVLLHSQVKRHIQEELQNLPNISCLETIKREYQPPRGLMQPMDTVGLEVLYAGDKELFASPGGRTFSDEHPSVYTTGGVLGSGDFGLGLKDILVTGASSYEYKGEETIGGRLLARWDYRLPVMWSGQIIQTPEGTGMVGLHGSYWADPQTHDVLQLKMEAEDIPPAVAVAQAVTTITYARTSLSDNATALLPNSADLRMVKLSGEVHHNLTEFTNCRVFEAQSGIQFSEPGSTAQPQGFGNAVVDDAARSLPGGLRIRVKLRTKITGELAVGSLIEGAVAATVTSQGAAPIAAGSPVRGRIRKLERHTSPFPYFELGLEFTELELQGVRYRFSADAAEIGRGPGVEPAIMIETRGPAASPAGVVNQGRTTLSSEVTYKVETIRPSQLAGIASFFVRGKKLSLPSGFETVWVTRSPAP